MAVFNPSRCGLMGEVKDSFGSGAEEEPPVEPSVKII